MASNPPAQCCTVGVRHEGESSGTLSSFEGIECYIAEPSGKNAKKDTAIIYLPDVIGIWQNSKLMVDQFAANGYYTIQPDIFNRDPVPLNRPEGFELPKWLQGGSTGDNPHTPPAIDPIVEKTIAFLKSKGFTKIGAVGYCFGAKYVVRFMAKGKGISVGYAAHPSFVEESELLAIQGPFSISAAETDEIFSVEKRHRSEVLLKETKQPYQINLFSGTSHGFSVRGDISQPQQKFAKEQAFYQAVAWFDEHLV